ncbi:MAG: hypothetical protein HYR84_04020 [Planctomycetes bacterium]|nr:hypothetical protein [Planctomycetota bacterium]
MKKFTAIAFTCSLLLTWTGAALPGDDDPRAIVMKAIEVSGGEAKLAKFNSMIMKEKGAYYGMDDGLPYTSVTYVKLPNHYKMEVVGIFTMCLDGDKGWIKNDKGVVDMSKEQVEIEQYNHKAGYMSSLLPLKNKAFTLKLDGTAKVGDQMTRVVAVSRKDYPPMKLYFDTKTHMRVKSQFTSKSAEKKGKEIATEMLFSDFRTVDGCQMPHHLVLMHDGKRFVEADLTEVKAAKLDAKAFAKPASD